MKLIDHVSDELIFSDNSTNIIDCLNNALNNNVNLNCTYFSCNRFLSSSFALKTTGSLFESCIFYDFKSWNGDISASVFDTSIISNSEFRFSDLSYVVFKKTTLRSCDISNSTLSASCFFDVVVYNSDFSGCYFGDGADIVNSVFIDCDFTDCDFTKINIKDSVFLNCKGIKDTSI